MKNSLIAAALILLALSYSYGQEIPLNTWRTHFSYKSVSSLTETPNRIFAAADVGLFSVGKNDGDIRRYSVADGFQGVDPSVVYYDEATEILLIGYRSGNLDVIRDGDIISLDLTSDSQVIGSKKINDIVTSGESAFVATDYGILNLDLRTIEIRATYREIGLESSQLGVNKLAFEGDSLFAATPTGIQSGDIVAGNLSDFQAWRRYGTFDSDISQLENANNRLYAETNGVLFAYESGQWQLIEPQINYPLDGIGSSDQGLLIYGAGRVGVMAASGALIEMYGSPEIEEVQIAITDTDAEAWIGAAQTGLWNDNGSAVLPFSPSGPLQTVPFHITYTNNEIFALPGGYSSTVIPWNSNFGYTTYKSGTWRNLTTDGFLDVVDALEFQGALYLASAGDGILRLEDASSEIIDASNSPLLPSDNGIIVPDLDGDNELYVLNHESQTPLLRRDSEGNWTAFQNLPNIARYALSLETFADFAWLIIPPARGGGLVAFNTGNGESRYLTEQPTQGGLTSRQVNAAVLDKDGFLWLGTPRGVSVWFSPFQFQGSIDVTEPVFEGRPLLIDSEVFSIAVDGGNRKWIGTDDGAWLFDPFADVLIYHFTTENSPLPSNKVLEVAINDETGEVFFLTDEGMASFRSDATLGEIDHRTVKIFPNPVDGDFNGSVAISGLVTDARVKVTNSAGHLIYETTSNGGTAAWPIRQSGDLASGMYYVFSVSSDGNETYVGKVAVVE